MKVRFIEGVVGPHILVIAGEVKDLPRSDAEYWIKEGLAELEEDEKPVATPVTVQEVKRAAKRLLKNGKKTNNGAN